MDKQEPDPSKAAKNKFTVCIDLAKVKSENKKKQLLLDIQ